jgi:hypothetical protein
LPALRAYLRFAVFAIEHSSGNGVTHLNIHQ